MAEDERFKHPLKSLYHRLQRIRTLMTSPTSTESGKFASWRGDHAAVRVADFDDAVGWYTEKLDFRLVQSWVLRDKKYGYLSPAVHDNFVIELIAGEGAENRPAYEDLASSLEVSGWHHVCFQVHSVDDAVAELIRRGVNIVSEPHDVAVLGRRVAFFADPWGNLFEVTHSIVT